MQQLKIKHTDPERIYRSVLAAGSFAGESVRNSAGDDLGTIDEIMIHIPSGRVAYAVLSFGGILGLGSKLFAVPWNALTVDEDKKSFILEMNKQTLESAPGFDKNNWPDMTDTAFGARVSAYYGVPYGL
jgi:sporulation protein YlmC with PRC-barrel domain